MTAENRPLLGFGPPDIQERPSQDNRTTPPQVSKPGIGRQRERLSPQFRELKAAFEAERATLADGVPDEVDPALVVVFDLAGSIQDFQNAINRVEGLEFLSQLLGEPAEADDDFHMVDVKTGRTDKAVQDSLYMVMSNAKAIDDLLNLFSQWQENPSEPFEHGLGKFKNAFHMLRSIRRWGPEDRIRETGLLGNWQEKLEVVGESSSTVKVEVELWFRRDPAQRATAESRVEEIISTSGGTVLDRSQISEISYHALLVELPIQEVQAVLNNGAEAIRLLTTDEVMFVSPFTPMTVVPAEEGLFSQVSLPASGKAQDLPRVALLDGLPLQNHAALAGRLLVDDPDGLSENYSLAARHHGTAMASLIIHGDLSAPGEPLDRKLYVRPIMRPHEFLPRHEETLPDQLLTDLVHRAVRRIQVGEGGKDAAAPSVRVINLSIGSEVRALSRRMSPLGRLLDWLAQEYNLLFIVSAGNHKGPIQIPASAADDVDLARVAATRFVYEQSLSRGIMPPGDAINALTVGAVHEDALENLELPDTSWDVTRPGAPAYYSATGPGVERSIKPDLHHRGGRALYTRPVVGSGQSEVSLELARTGLNGPGLQVAAPGPGGALDNTVFTTGSSNATALVTREASRLFDVLEAGMADEDNPLPNSLYHPLLVRALLAHASSWGEWESQLRRDLGLSGQEVRRKLSAWLGYGRLDTTRLGVAATNRAVLVAGGHIQRDQRHTYRLPLPPSLRSKAEWHRFTFTLAYAAPTIGQLTRYRSAKVYFDTPDVRLAAGERVEAEHRAVRRGSLQHEQVQGTNAMIFGDGDDFPIHIECMKDAQNFDAKRAIRYALVVSVETTEEVSTTIHDEVRSRLRQSARERSRGRVQA